MTQSLSEQPGMTGTLTIRYRRPTPLHRDLRFEGTLERVEGRKIFTRGRCFDGDTMTAEAEGLFVRVDFQKLAEMMTHARRSRLTAGAAEIGVPFPPAGTPRVGEALVTCRRAAREVPMSVEPNAAELRRRAAELRRLADHLAATPLAEVAERAGPDTWVSPRADALRDAARPSTAAASPTPSTTCAATPTTSSARPSRSRQPPSSRGPLTCRSSATTRLGCRRCAPPRRRPCATSCDAQRRPAAASALRVAALVRTNLEQRWLPAIDRLMASDAMLAWTHDAPAWARGLVGADLGRQLAARAAELTVGVPPTRSSTS